MLNLEVLSPAALKRRTHWVHEIVKISGHFGNDSSRINTELHAEVKKHGADAIVDHLRLCGSIPESYGHDTSEEKLYSKYTDAVLATAYEHIGLKSVVLDGRGDSADVEAVGKDYSLVADAKVFRLSRTAKNQKDFKIEAMHGWKRGRPHAMVVCPIYQLPARSSQIYQQAINRSVCIFSYSHLAIVVQLASKVSGRSAQGLLLVVLRCTETLNPTKDSIEYWTNINRTMLKFHPEVERLWRIEKIAMAESLTVAKQEALNFLAEERERVMRLSHKDAIALLVKDRNVDGRERVIRDLEDNGILSTG